MCAENMTDKAIEAARDVVYGELSKFFDEHVCNDIADSAIQAYEAAKWRSDMRCVAMKPDGEVVEDIYNKIMNSTKYERFQILRMDGTTVTVTILPQPPKEGE